MTESAPKPFTLLAMPASGEAYLARDDRGHIWLVQDVLGYEPEPASESDVDEAVLRFDWNRLGVQFATWDELARYVVEQVEAEPGESEPPSYAAYSKRDVELTLQEVELAGDDDPEVAYDILLGLLDGCQAVREDATLLKRVTGQLRRLRRKPPVSPVSPGELQAALERMKLPAVA